MPSSFPLNITELTQLYRDGQLDPQVVLRSLVAQINADQNPGVWIYRCTQDQVDAQLAAAMERKRRGIAQPLLGIPFAGKDNIDIAGIPTTVACPAFSYVPKKSATVVQRLCDAGAIVMGTTNLDQFAAGLVGTRSPYGICQNPFNPKYISGGSSSGSAVAVATGMVSFALGTDTAGSGRVPAAFNNIVGLKPTRGLMSCNGVVPACQSLDCVSVFTLTCDDARVLMQIMEGFDAADPYSRRRKDLPPVSSANSASVRVGVPEKHHLRFFGDTEAESLYRKSIDQLAASGATVVEIDYAPFAEAAAMLYAGPWLAERYLVVKDLLDRDPLALLPVTRSILEPGRTITAADGFAAMHRLEAIRLAARSEMSKIDMLLLPTTGTIYTIDQVQADPIQLNTNLGYYTNFVNLLDLCGLAVPGGFKETAGVPLGVTLIGAAGTESLLLKFGDVLHRAAGTGTGIARQKIPPSQGVHMSDVKRVKVAVLGAHLSGMPLNHQMTDRKATLVRTVKTAPIYRFYALPNTTPPKPGLVRNAPGEGGHSIELEVWEMPVEAYGSFIAGIGAPLGIGTILLEDGESVQGFLCEPYAVIGATDISALGGWRAYISSKK